MRARPPSSASDAGHVGAALLADEPLGKLRDALGFIADAFEIGQHLDHRQHEPKIRRRGLTSREDVGAALVDRELGRIDLLFALADLGAARGIAIDEHRERGRDLLFAEAAHREHLTADVFDLAVELAGDVLGKV